MDSEDGKSQGVNEGTRQGRRSPWRVGRATDLRAEGGHRGLQGQAGGVKQSGAGRWRDELRAPVKGRVGCSGVGQLSRELVLAGSWPVTQGEPHLP